MFSPKGATIVLPQVLTNIGNAYDPQTGLFAAPVSGLYMFFASYMHADTGGPEAYVQMYVDGNKVTESVSDDRSHTWDHGSMRAIVHLNTGQRVRLSSCCFDVRLHGGMYTTFSGFLIRAD
nr:hypothetical protein BaRGS_000773 [Batillaria attramentaria]